MEKLVLEADAREIKGKQNKRLRKEGKVPAVIYGHGTDPQLIAVDNRAIEKVYAKAGGNKIVALKVGDGKSKNALIYDVQQDGRTGSIIHADFYAVKMDEKIKAEVPLHFIGESTAVYQEDGTLFKNLEVIEVEALPADLPESIEVDISILDDFEKSIHVSDLKVLANVTVLNDQEELIAKVEPPRSQEELEELDAEITEELPSEDEEGEEAEADAEGEPAPASDEK